MTLSFSKFHGAGNDFIIIAADSLMHPLSESTIRTLCDRHFGIGADGLILASMLDDGTLGMRYFNADGRESTLCGNGGRCIAAWADLEHRAGPALEIRAADGIHHSLILSRRDPHWQVRLRMQDTPLPRQQAGGFFIHTGSPHHVTLVDDTSAINVQAEGARIRYSDHYSPDGTNVDFLEDRGSHLQLRTYERGVEAETLACGTGTVAAALTAAYLRKLKGKVDLAVHMPGGKLLVSCNAQETGFSDIWLEGPATCVFRGEINLNDHEQDP